MFAMLHLKCFRVLGTGARWGNKVRWGAEDGGEVEDRGAVDAISILFYFATRGRESILFPICGGRRFYEGERHPDASSAPDVRALGASIIFFIKKLMVSYKAQRSTGQDHYAFSRLISI
jgi:hypothetical protein